jgi:hypothetical protein
MKGCSSNTCSVREEAQIGVEDALGLKMNVLSFEQVPLLFKKAMTVDRDQVEEFTHLVGS